MTQGSAAATEAARDLWARDAAGTGAPEEAELTADRVCAQLRAGLTRWIGPEGYRALLDRALGHARVEHPALNNLSCVGGNEHEIAAAVREHGAAEVAAGIVTLVATVIHLLGRVVGEELAVELVRQMGVATPGSASNIQTSGGRDG